MAKKDSTAASANPMIGEDNPLDTLENVKGVIWFLDFALPGVLNNNGGNENTTHGLEIILQCAEQAMDHAIDALNPKAVRHG